MANGSVFAGSEKTDCVKELAQPGSWVSAAVVGVESLQTKDVINAVSQPGIVVLSQPIFLAASTGNDPKLRTAVMSSYWESSVVMRAAVVVLEIVPFVRRYRTTFIADVTVSAMSVINCVSGSVSHIVVLAFFMYISTTFTIRVICVRHWSVTWVVTAKIDTSDAIALPATPSAEG